MNWEAVGAIGEVFGALVVVGTLLYLALQIRQNSNLAKADYYNKAQMGFSSFRSMVNAHPQVFLKMSKLESLSEEEEIIASNICGELAFNYAILYENERALALEKTSAVTGFCLAFSGIPSAYEIVRGQLIVHGFDEFVDEIEQKMSEDT